MKIVLANKYLYPRGGDCVYTLRLMELLKKAGHEVAPLSMHHPENIATDYDRYFVSHIDFRQELKRFNPAAAVKVLSRAIINTQAVYLMERLIEDFKPDIIHLQNIHHQLTPAIIAPAVKYDVPIVWTLHDYNLYCPDHTFLRNGIVCDKCTRGRYYNAVLHRCKKGSVGASLVAAIECGLFSPKRLARHVHRFLCPSRFLADVLLDNGIEQEKVEVVPNFLPAIDIEPSGYDGFIYVGRLSKEKGVDTLLKAFKQLARGRLTIVGDGPMRPELERMARRMSLDGVEFVGRQPQESVFRMLSASLAAVVPSKCWENFPFTVLEAMAAQKPVIASAMGGMTELVEHRTNGYFFVAGNADELARYMNRLLEKPDLARKLGRAGCEKVVSAYGSDKHYQKIIQIYRQAIDNNNNGESPPDSVNREVTATGVYTS